jgi:hypothetical protein
MYWKQYNDHGLPSGTPLKNMFGAVSAGSGGWKTGNYGPNREVVSGFLTKLASLSSGVGMRLGLYGNQTAEFQGLLDASSWTSPEAIVVWIAAYGSFADCTAVKSAYCPMPTVGGYFPMIWQYSGTPDYDITPYAGFISNGYWTPTKPPGIC